MGETCGNCGRRKSRAAQGDDETPLCFAWRGNPSDGWDCMRTRAQRAEQERDDERAAHEETRRREAAMRDALTNLRARFRWGCDPAALTDEDRAIIASRRWPTPAETHRAIDAALASDAGRGWLAPTGKPGSVAVEVADGLAWATPEQTLYFCSERGRLTQMSAAMLVDTPGRMHGATRAYLDPARCIRAAVLALDEEARGGVIADALFRVAKASGVTSDTNTDWRRFIENKLTHEQAIATADPDALLAALQAL